MYLIVQCIGSLHSISCLPIQIYCPVGNRFVVTKVVRYPDFELPIGLYRRGNIAIFDIIVNFERLPRVSSIYTIYIRNLFYIANPCSLPRFPIENPLKFFIFQRTKVNLFLWVDLSLNYTHESVTKFA